MKRFHTHKTPSYIYIYIYIYNAFIHIKRIHTYKTPSYIHNALIHTKRIRAHEVASYTTQHPALVIHMTFNRHPYAYVHDQNRVYIHSIHTYTFTHTTQGTLSVSHTHQDHTHQPPLTNRFEPAIWTCRQSADTHASTPLATRTRINVIISRRSHQRRSRLALHGTGGWRAREADAPTAGRRRSGRLCVNVLKRSVRGYAVVGTRDPKAPAVPVSLHRVLVMPMVMLASPRANSLDVSYFSMLPISALFSFPTCFRFNFL
jgi:hypothetical protein